MRCTRALIYGENIRSNILEIKKLLNPSTKLCCAVKADGYGNSASIAAKIAVECGAEFLAIATVQEGIELQENGINANFILLSPCSPEEFTEVAAHNIIPVLFDEEMISTFDDVSKKFRKNKKHGVFLAVDTGMGRIGCLPEEASNLAKKINSSNNISLMGVITHFAVSDSISDENKEYTERQFRAFTSALNSIKSEGIDPGICSCSASAAAIANPEMQLDMIRPGIILYGYYPDEITQNHLESKGIHLHLRPAMQLETKIAAIRRFKAGESISYGRTWKTTSETDIAVLPIGYADGLLRRLSPGLKVTINGKLYPVVGRICMDQCMVDIGIDNHDVKRWDTAIIFGPKEGDALTDAADLAKMTSTIPYEIMTSITKRVPRILANT
ncbi:MAG: alanine racemase [Treponema sp.]|nr:alanine racemase [Treponema sp.]